MSIILDQLDRQFNLAHDCIRACVYADYIGRKLPKGDAWLSIGDMCYSDAIITWNAIFGSDSQESHWKKMAPIIPIPKHSTLTPFGKTMIANYLNITNEEWEQFHASMVSFRNTRAAHFIINLENGTIPDLLWAKKSACHYREWLISLLQAYQAAGKNVKITETTEKEMLATFEVQIAEICR